MSSSVSVREALRLSTGTGRLADHDPDARPVRPGGSSGRKLSATLQTDAEQIASLQEKLYAEATVGGRRSVLLVLQGMDTAGKGGTTEHVVSACGPIGVQYTAFKKPTEEELAHDFLWRIRRCVPPPGVIGIFDRSHYEDVLIARVHDAGPAGGDRRPVRTDQRLRAGARRCRDDGGEVLPQHLLRHPARPAAAPVAPAGQALEVQPRPTSTERAKWADYQDAYQRALQRCDTEAAPWYVVPGDSKKYRNWAVAELLREVLVELDPQYPQTELDIADLERRLQPPN